MRWTALLQVPSYANYGFRAAAGRLEIDGTEVLNAPTGGRSETAPKPAYISLARGEHFVSYEATPSGGQLPTLEWAPISVHTDVIGNPQSLDDLEWQPIPTHLLVPAEAPAGLYGEVTIEGQLTQRRIDSTLATCCLTNEASGGKPYEVRWRGTLDAPASGVYTMTFVAQGALNLSLDGGKVLSLFEPSDEPRSKIVELTAGMHDIEIIYRVEGTGGTLEWSWVPPGGQESIVPPSVLSPPPEVGVGPPLTTEDQKIERDLRRDPLDIVP
jgi:hypothetical protein